MFSIPNFAQFRFYGDETAGTRWRKYLARFETMILAMGITGNENAARKKALLLHVAGDEIFDIVDTFTNEQKGDNSEEGFQTLAKSLTEYFAPKRNVAYETIDLQAKAMEECETAHFKKKAKQQRSKPKQNSSQHNQSSNKSCNWCGGDRHAKKNCLAKNRICNNCKKVGHYSAVCYAGRNQKQARQIRSTEHEYCFGVGKTPTVEINLNRKKVKFFVDTGASVNVIDEATAKSINAQMKPTQVKIHAYGSNQPLTVQGKISVTVNHKNTYLNRQTFFVIKSSVGGNLLGASLAQELGLVQFAFKVQLSIFDQYPDLFEGIGKLKNTKVKLYIDKSVKPVCQPHRRIPFHLRKKVDAELKRLEDLDIIEKVEGPTPWVSPIVATPKPKNPEDICICVDMRLPNQAIERTRHVIPTLDDILIRLNKACVFSKLDLNSGYHQLELDEESRNITTFSTHSGLRRYKRLNFGVTSAAEIFQNHIAEQLADIQNAINTSDDILVYGRNQQEHDEALFSVLNRFREVGLTLNKDKCQLSKDTIEFYGFVFSKSGVSPDIKKVEAITALSRPTTPKEVRSFLGMTNYLSRFISEYADTTKPLRDLTKISTEWSWGEIEENAFQKLKTQLSSPIDFSGPFPSGEYILVVVDDYSRYPEIEIVSSTSVKSTLPKLHAIFA
ncbi:hypothetical protein Ahia01_000337700 [Argonauta hians]